MPQCRRGRLYLGDSYLCELAIRTLNVRPPIVDGGVRIVEIAGFDEPECGGTHVHSTAEVGRVRLVRFDNEGRDNKRLYWELDAPEGSGRVRQATASVNRQPQ